MSDSRISDVFGTDLVENILNVASRGTEGIPLTINSNVAQDIIDKFNLKLEQRFGKGDLTGEKSALFEWNNTTIRLTNEFPNKWRVYKGDWKRDPRWAGD